MPISTTANWASAGHPRQRQRHAPVVVEAASAAWTGPAGQHVAQHLLGRGLADRPGDRDHRAPRARPRRAAERLQRGLHVVHDQQRRVRGDARRARATTSAAAAPRQRIATKSCPSRASVSATNRSPGASVRLSIDTPGAQSRWPRPPVAAGASAAVHSAHAAPPVERGHGHAGLFGVVEGQHVVADDLPGLVALAGDQQRVAWAKGIDPAQDGFGPVAHLQSLGAALPHRGADRGRVLAARVVVGDDHEVGRPGRGLPHERALGAVPASAPRAGGISRSSRPRTPTGAAKAKDGKEATATGK